MIINKNKEVYYPNGNLKAGGINDSDLKYAVPKNFNGGGSSGGGGVKPLIVKEARIEGEADVLDHTWKEIDDALQAGIPAYVSRMHNGLGGSERYMFPIVETDKNTNIVSGEITCTVVALGSSSGSDYNTDTEDGFPRSGAN